MCIVKEPSMIKQVGVLCALISFSVFCLFVCLLLFFFCVFGSLSYIGRSRWKKVEGGDGIGS